MRKNKTAVDKEGNSSENIKSEESDLFGIDLFAEVIRLRALNKKLANALANVALGSVIVLVFGAITLMVKPEPDRFAVDPAGRAYPMQSLVEGDPPDSKITRMAGDCINGLLNHAFHNFQTTVERTIGECFTNTGSESVRAQLEPMLERMKREELNMAATYVIQPFIDKRRIENRRKVYKVQGIIAVGYRGRGSSSIPINYTFECDIVRVPYDSNIEGIRLQNLLLKIKT